MSQKFQYISDIHLEHGNTINLEPIAPYLILAGDIGNPFANIYKEFLQDVAEKYAHVFLIAGNHEYYSKRRITMKDTEKQIKSCCPPNVHFLQNDCFHIPDTDIVIFGTTLWTEVQIATLHMLFRYVSDYRMIPDFIDDKCNAVEKCNALHAHAVQCLQKALDSNPEKRIILVCHHIPQEQLTESNFLGTYASNVDIVHSDSIVAVVYGHTHTPMDSGKFHCNPLGYPDERRDDDFVKCFEV
jgi:predicted phosphohydrolase